jgi:uncharacterized protein YjiS (DUF1127 family)
MSTITAQRPWPYRPAQQAASPSRRGQLCTGLARLAALLRRWHRLRRDTHQLMSFSDAMLKDIGLSRGQIERVVMTGRDWA